MADRRGATSHQADLQLIARLQQKQAKLDGSSFEGRYGDALRRQVSIILPITCTAAKQSVAALAERQGLAAASSEPAT